MPFKATISTTNFPRPKKLNIKVGDATHEAADHATVERVTWLLENDVQSIAAAIQAQPTEPHVTVYADYYMGAKDSIVYADATNASFTVYLPPANQVAGQTFKVKRLNGGANNVNVSTVPFPGQTASPLIDGAATINLATQYLVLNVHCDGANFWQV